MYDTIPFKKITTFPTAFSFRDMPTCTSQWLFEAPSVRYKRTVLVKRFDKSIQPPFAFLLETLDCTAFPFAIVSKLPLPLDSLQSATVNSSVCHLEFINYLSHAASYAYYH